MATLLERVWNKVEKRGPEDCWLWTGGVGQKGQPTISGPGKTTASPRRILWAEAHGEELAKTRQVSTSCGVPRCLNAAHFVLKPYMDHEVRFWKKVNKAGPILRPELGPCWEWTGGFFSSGYATFRMHQKQWRALRLAWEFTYGPIVGHVPGDPEREICVCHKCDNPKCVRPDHLFLGHDRDNVADMVAKGRNSTGPKHAATMGKPKPLTKPQEKLLRAVVAASPRGFRLTNAGHHQTARKLRALGLITDDVEPKATAEGIAKLSPKERAA